MSIFNQILGAINNPNQQASPDQLSAILQTVQQLSGQQNVSPSATQTAMAIVGKYVQSSLQQRRNSQGDSSAEAIVNQFGGTGANPNALQALFTPSQQQQVAQEASQKTGLNLNTVQAMLPILVPLVLNLLKTGSSNSNRGNSSSTLNTVLTNFLDPNHDGSVDIADAISMAAQFLNRR